MEKATSSMIFNQELLPEDSKTSTVNNDKLPNPEKKRKSFFDTYRRDLEAMKIPDVEQRSLRYIPGLVPDWSEQRRIIAEANRSLDGSADFRPLRHSPQKTPSQERNTTVLSAYIVDKQQKAEARRQQYRAQKIKDAQLKLNKDRILYMDWKKSMNEDEKIMLRDSKALYETLRKSASMPTHDYEDICNEPFTCSRNFCCRQFTYV